MNRRHFFAVTGLAALAAGCARKSKRTPHIRVEDFQTYDSGDPEIRIACIGDSITFGAGITNRETMCYPAQLAGLLGPRFTVRNLGHNGATANRNGDLPYVGTTEFQALATFHPEVAILMLGTNDTKPQNWKGREEFEREYRSLIATLRALKPRPKIWACFPPPVYKDAWGINAGTLDEMIEATEVACDRDKVPIIDLNDALSGHPEMFPDGVHPDAKGAELMALTVFQAVRP